MASAPAPVRNPTTSQKKSRHLDRETRTLAKFSLSQRHLPAPRLPRPCSTVGVGSGRSGTGALLWSSRDPKAYKNAATGPAGGVSVSGRSSGALAARSRSRWWWWWLRRLELCWILGEARRALFFSGGVGESAGASATSAAAPRFLFFPAM